LLVDFKSLLGQPAAQAISESHYQYQLGHQEKGLLEDIASVFFFFSERRMLRQQFRTQWLCGAAACVCSSATFFFVFGFFLFLFIYPFSLPAYRTLAWQHGVTRRRVRRRTPTCILRVPGLG
jgi:hypothetical protein